MLPNGEPNAVAPKPRRRSWLSKTLTAAMLACFAVGGLFASQAAFKANSIAYSSPVAPPTGQAIALTAPSSEPQYLTKNVEDVQEGDYVLARDEHDHEIGYRKVVEVYRRTSFHLRHLKFRDAHGHCQTLSTTDEHPFLDAEKNQFVNAGDMPLCTKVTAPNGDLQTLVHTKREDHPEGIPVFNFQVEGFHTYYVHQQGAEVPALVHNAEYSFPDNPNQLLEGLPRDAKGHIHPNELTRIRPESHDLLPGETFNARHHGQHYHVETRNDPSKSWNNKKNVTKSLPPNYTPGGGTGFLPGETFPGM